MTVVVWDLYGDIHKNHGFREKPLIILRKLKETDCSR